MPVGLLLAAGAGTRMGRPKALVTGPDGASWLRRGVEALTEGGCVSVAVVLGAELERASRLLHRGSWSSAPGGGVQVVVAEDWATGMSASLRAGLRYAATTGALSACVTLVDLPDVGADVVRRVTTTVGDTPEALGRAAYRGVPGHPVVLGRDHWQAVVDRSAGDRGARDYLREHGARLVECGDLAGGHDIDTPEQMR